MQGITRFVVTTVSITLFSGLALATEGSTSQSGTHVDLNNNRAVYTPSLNQSKTTHYDAGAGNDTIRLRLTAHELSHPKFFADLLRFNFYLMNFMNSTQKHGLGETFHFGHFNLKIRNFEILEIEVIETVKSALKQQSSKQLNFKDYPNSMTQPNDFIL